mmetsp:Transcript_76900/g.243036  ORF Transcript_76900/g.243036 Transcript_76900/m.243036 type:complete len:418 (-) Transcript_76900:100-1353(-)
MLVSFGVAFEVAATMCGTFGKQLVSYSGKVRPAKRARLFKFMGLTATTLFGPVLDALAYALAPQSLVAPLNGLDIVWNACSAPFTLGEPLTRSYALGSVLVFMGSSLSAHFAQHHDREGTLERQREIFFSWRLAVWVLAGVGGLLVSFWVIRRRPRGVGDWQRGLALGGTAGFVAGNMFFLSEALGAVRWSLATGDWSAWRHPLPYLVSLGAVTVAVSNVPLMAKALEEYDALFMITLFAGCQIVTACVSAWAVLREMDGTPLGDRLGYWACIGSIVAGLLVVGRKARLEADHALPLAAAPLEPPLGDAAAEARPPAKQWTSLGPVVWAGAYSGVAYASMDSGSEGPEEDEAAGRPASRTLFVSAPAALGGATAALESNSLALSSARSSSSGGDGGGSSSGSSGSSSSGDVEGRAAG